ncbi:MAG: hypothetical protein ACYS9X_14085 [Planctomycetota bacterium]|jgi:hypothetical protein
MNARNRDVKPPPSDPLAIRSAEPAEPVGAIRVGASGPVDTGGIERAGVRC